jgi:hypothetical protein
MTTGSARGDQLNEIIDNISSFNEVEARLANVLFGLPIETGAVSPGIVSRDVV